MNFLRKKDHIFPPRDEDQEVHKDDQEAHEDVEEVRDDVQEVRDDPPGGTFK